jgi:hypothetical protein
LVLGNYSISNTFIAGRIDEEKIIFQKKAMDKDQKNNQGRQDEKKKSSKEKKQHLEEKIDEELDQSFPASDPPSYSQPGNDDIKEGC